MDHSSIQQLVATFKSFVLDIFQQKNLTPQQVDEKLTSVLGRLTDKAVQTASSQLLDLELDIEALSDYELANKMQMHVTGRSGGGPQGEVLRLKNSAWSMMLVAAKRLRKNKSLTFDRDYEYDRAQRIVARNSGR